MFKNLTKENEFVLKELLKIIKQYQITDSAFFLKNKDGSISESVDGSFNFIYQLVLSLLNYSDETRRAVELAMFDFIELKNSKPN